MSALSDPWEWRLKDLQIESKSESVKSIAQLCVCFLFLYFLLSFLLYLGSFGA